MLSILLGWLAGGLANWAADVLPGRGGDKTETGATPPVQVCGPRAILHFLTLPWYPFRSGVCPHCGERRPLRAPLLEAATVLAFALAWMNGAALGLMVYYSQVTHRSHNAAG